MPSGGLRLQERQTASQTHAKGQPTAGMADSLRSRCPGTPSAAQTLHMAQQLRAAEDACVMETAAVDMSWPEVCL